MIKARNLHWTERWRQVSQVVDISAADLQRKGFVFPVAVFIRAIKFVYSVATDGGTTPEDIEVGIDSDNDLYYGAAPTASQALGIVQDKTLDSTARLEAGEMLLIGKSAGTGGTNTGEVTVCVEYEVDDAQVG